MRFAGAALIVFFLTTTAHAQVAGGRLVPPNERVHPELVDSAWGPATRSGWEEAWDHNWKRANTIFDSLYRAHPDAVEALIGLGFVARGQLKFHEARRWWRRALEVDPGNQQVMDLLNVAQWDRPGRVEYMERGTRVNGEFKNSHGGGAVVPLSTQLTATYRAGIFGAGDALEQFFIEPTDTAGSGHYSSAGIVVRASERYVVTTYWDRWVADGNATQYWFTDLADRVSQHYAFHLITRQTLSGQPPAVWGVGFDYSPTIGQALLLRFGHATVSTPVETQAQSRIIYIFSPPGHWVGRLGLVIDSDPHLAAQTLYGTGYYYFTPHIGIRADAISRWGFVAQRSLQTGIVMLW